MEWGIKENFTREESDGSCRVCDKRKNSEHMDEKRQSDHVIVSMLI